MAWLKSAAVMARRKEKVSPTARDYYPTPPGATHALMKWLVDCGEALSKATAYEPAAGGGHMAEVLRLYFADVLTADIGDYGYQTDCQGDFLAGDCDLRADWLITNPPFVLFDSFAVRSVAKYDNVALLARVQALEGQKRHRALWKKAPPTEVLVFINRVTMARGGLPWEVGGGHSAVAYGWFLWRKARAFQPTHLHWIHYREDEGHRLLP